VPTARRPADAPSFAVKKRPTQQRARDTYEAILAATAALLQEVGIERLSTNLVCQRVGISPPALYQYFPNKYAVLHELGTRLMDQQNALLQAWATPATMRLPPAAFTASLLQLFATTHQLTSELTAGDWITRALRAVPALHHVRTSSHDHVTGLVHDAFMAAYPLADSGRVRTTVRVVIECVYAALELLFDDPSQDAEAVAGIAADLACQQLLRLRPS
jgi:AcrR family transcriptional regulator